MRHTLCAFVFGFLLVTGTQSNCAALTFRAAMDPIRLQGLPGQIFTRHFTLTLGKNEARTRFRVRVEDWWRSEDNRQSYYKEPGTLSHSCGMWTKVNPVEPSVEPGATLDVRISVAIPGAAKSGGYWCALTLDEVPDPLQAQPHGVGVRLLTSLSVGIYINVVPVHRAATISEVALVDDMATVKVHNDGDCPLNVEGRFEFLRPNEQKPFATAPLSRSTLLTEPIDTIRMTAQLPDSAVLPPGRYLVRAILDIGLDHYIGVQKEMEIRRETPSSTTSDRK